jgi:hypothetical protein
MAIEWTTLIEGGIPILGGLYATALGYGVIRTSMSPPSELRQKVLNQLRWLGPVVVLFGIFMGWQAHQYANHPPAEVLAPQIAARLKLPVKVDEITQLVGVEGRGDDIIYIHSVAATPASLGGREHVRRTLQQVVVDGACKNEGMRTLHRGGYTLKMRYGFQGTVEEVVISLPPGSCATT